jgi:chlorobactene glucosyltransferase
VLAAAWPWLVFPAVILWRLRRSRALSEWPAEAPADAPRVTVIIPARNERHNIGACVRSVLSTSYPDLAVVVVDDHSDDGTAEAALEAAAGDARLRVVSAPALAPGWFGKQWACAAGAAATAAPAPRGEVLCFADADTTHAPDLVGRAVNAMRGLDAGLLSVIGRQELGTFWERVAQPHVLAMLAFRYGGTEHVTRSPRRSDKIANGQCLLVTREAYEAVGTHASVRRAVSEDLVLAQRVFDGGRAVALVTGGPQLATRMYTSLGDLVRGWRKNVYAGGREAIPFGIVGQAVYPLLLLVTPVATLGPPLAAAAGALGLVSAAATAWTAVAAVALLVFWAIGYRKFDLSPLYALTYPLGAAVLLWIVLGAIARGSRVSWKGRNYTVGAEAS